MNWNYVTHRTGTASHTTIALWRSSIPSAPLAYPSSTKTAPAAQKLSA